MFRRAYRVLILFPSLLLADISFDKLAEIASEYKDSIVLSDAAVNLELSINEKAATAQDILAYINELEEGEKSLIQENLLKSPLRFFGGSSSFCRFSGLVNCCGSSKRLLELLKLKKCRNEEKELAQLKERSACIKLGKRKSKQHYCCFRSEQERNISNAAKGILGLGWGSAKSPNCQGLSLEELKQLDFDELSERSGYSIQEMMEILFIDRKRANAIHGYLEEKLKSGEGI